MHTRPRHVISALKKRSRIWPVLGLLGPRQVGKSTFLRGQWAKEIDASYITLDKQEVRQRAESALEHFLVSESADLSRPLIIDEAQKIPQLFDSIKAIVDEKRRLGFFTLCGSVEFSDKSNVRESLAGRIGLGRLYPMTIREIAQESLVTPFIADKPAASGCEASQIETWLERGGMPIFCWLHDRTERGLAIDSWSEALCYRDLLQLRGARYDGDLAKKILIFLAKNPFADQAQIARSLGIDARRIGTHLAGLEALFVIFRFEPLPKSTGKSRYLLFDAAVARHWGAEREDCLPILFVNECYAQHEYATQARPTIHYYRPRGGADFALVIEREKFFEAYFIKSSVTFSRHTFKTANALAQSLGSVRIKYLAPIQTAYKESKIIEVVPWTSMA